MTVQPFGLSWRWFVRKSAVSLAIVAGTLAGAAPALAQPAASREKEEAGEHRHHAETPPPVEHHRPSPPPGRVLPPPIHPPGPAHDDARTIERFLDSGFFKRFVELIEQNAQLRAQLEIQERLAQRERSQPAQFQPGRSPAEGQSAERESEQRARNEEMYRRLREKTRIELESRGVEPQSGFLKSVRERPNEQRAQVSSDASEVERLTRRVRELEAQVRELSARQGNQPPRERAEADRKPGAEGRRADDEDEGDDDEDDDDDEDEDDEDDEDDDDDDDDDEERRR
ncbi:MAG: hypothetical protein ACTHOU_19280 [Aureliella sp.]